MNPLQILQIVNMGIGTFLQFKHQPTQPTKDQIKTYILASTTPLQMMGKLVIHNQIAFMSAIDKMVDSVYDMLKTSEWHN